MACEVKYKGQALNFQEFAEQLHNGLLDEFIAQGVIKNVPTIKSIQDAIQEQSAARVLSRQQGEAGKAGGVGEGMGQGKQGKEAPKASKEEVTSPEATVALDEETEALVSGLAAERRAKGKYTADGVTYTRNEKGQGVLSEQGGEVRFTSEPGGGGVVVPFRYKLVEAETVQPSHTGGIRNPNFFIPEAQPKNRNDQASLQAEDSFATNPRFGELGEDNTAYKGAPVVNDRGEVIQGNNRAAGLKSGYKSNNPKYKQDLANNAEKFGFTKEQVEGMKNPMLVREVVVNDQKAIELGNYDVKDLETAGKRRIDPIALAARLPLSAKESLAKLIVAGETIKESIKDNADEIFALIRPYINTAIANTILSNGKLNTVGVEDVENVFTQFLFRNGDANLPQMYEGLPSVQREGLKKALPYILSAGVGKSIISDIQEAIMASHYFNSSGASTFGEWANKAELFTDNKAPKDIYTPLALKIAEILNTAKTASEIAGVPTRTSPEPSSFAKYSQLTKGEEATMFEAAKEGVERGQAVKEVFGVEYTPRKEYASSAKFEESLEKQRELEKEKAEKEKAKQAKKEIKEKLKSSQEAINRTAEQIAKIEKIKQSAAEKAERIISKIGGLKNLTPQEKSTLVEDLKGLVKDLVDLTYLEIKQLLSPILIKNGLTELEAEDIINEAVSDYVSEDEELIGITNAYDKASRAARGLDPVAKAARQTNEEVWDKTVQKIKNGDIELRNKINTGLITRLANGEVEVISPEIQAAILYDRIFLQNEKEIYVKQLAEKGNTMSEKERLNIVAQIAEIDAKIEENELANANAGRTWGRTGVFRQALAARDYTLKGVIARAKSMKLGESLNTAEQAILSDLTRQFEDLKKEQEKLQKAVDEQIKIEREIAAKEAYRKAKMETSTVPPTSKIKTKGKEIANKLRAAKIQTSSYTFSALVPIPPSIVNVGIEAAALSIEKTAIVADAIAKGIEAIKNEASGWYKNLSLDEKQRFNDWFGGFVNEKIAEPKEEKSTKSTSDLLTDLAIKADGVLNNESWELEPLLKKILKQEVVNGAETLDEVAQTVFDFLSDSVENLDIEDIKDLMSGYGSFKELSKDPLTEKIRKIRNLGRLEGRLRDVKERKQLPKRTGREIAKLETEERAINKEIARLIKELGLASTPTEEEKANKWKSQRDAVVNRLNNKIEDLNRQIDQKQRDVKTAKNQITDDEIKELQEQVEALEKVLSEIPEVKISDEEKRIETKRIDLENRIADAKRKIREGDVSIKPTQSVTSPEIERLENELGELNKQIAKMREDGKTMAEKIADAQKRIDIISRAEISRLESIRSKLIDEGYLGEEVKVSVGKKIGEFFSISKPKKAKIAERSDAIQETIDQLKRDISGLIPVEVKQEALIDKAMARREALLKSLEEKLRTGNFDKKKPRVLPSSIKLNEVNAKIEEVKQKIDFEIEKIRLSRRGNFQKLGEFLFDALSLPKTLIASIDLSGPLRQGIVYAYTKPGTFLKAFAEMHKFAFNKAAYERWQRQLKQDPRYVEYTKQYGLYMAEESGRMSAREEMFISRFTNALKKIPVYGQLLAGTERAYIGFGNKLRWDVFNSYVDMVEDMPLTPEEKQQELKELAKLVNNTTGKGSLGVLAGAKKPLNLLMFSPSLVASRLHPFTATARMIYGGEKPMPKVARRETLKAYGKFFGAAVLTGLLLKWALGDDDEDKDVEIDPRSSDFLKVRVNDVRTDYTGGYMQPFIVLAKILGGTKNAVTGEIKKFGDEGYGGATRMDLIETFFANKLNPAASLVYNELLTGKAGKKRDRNKLYEYMFGEIPNNDLNLVETAFNLTTPLYLRDMAEIINESPKTAIFVVPSALYGSGINKFGAQTMLTPNTKEYIETKTYLPTPARQSDDKKMEYYVFKQNGDVINTGKQEFLNNESLTKFNKYASENYKRFIKTLNKGFMNSMNENQQKEIMNIIKAESDNIAEIQLRLDMAKSAPKNSKGAKEYGKMVESYQREIGYVFEDFRNAQERNKENNAYDFVEFKERVKGSATKANEFIFNSKNISSSQFDKINKKVKYVYKNKAELQDAYMDAIKSKNKTREQSDLINAVEGED